MKQINKISVKELGAMAANMYGNLVKGVVDINKKTLVIDAEMHADGEQLLLEKGSAQNDLWGINLYPDKFGTDEIIEFDFMINIRPRQNNMSRGVEDNAIRKKIIAIVKEKVSQ